MVARATGEPLEFDRDMIRMMDRDFVLPETHLAMAGAYLRAGEQMWKDLAELHFRTALQFLDAIIAREPEVGGNRAMHVLSGAEQYVRLHYLQVTPLRRSVRLIDGRAYDAWDTLEGPLLLDITSLFGRFSAC